ncbi:4721_t:CDS:1, partial [Racocetra fulgida]
ARVLVDNKDELGKGSLFYYLRHALKLLPNDIGIFAVFTDTISNISNFSPASKHDQSPRVATGRAELFKPFYLIDTVDINVDHKKASTLKDSECPQSFFMYGRPLWSSLTLSPFDNVKGFEPHDIINLAMEKLVGGMAYTWWKKEYKNKISSVESLAILGPRLCIDIVPQSEYASDLVSSYMRLCLKISDDRKSIITSMPTEPVLAEASAQIMNDPDINLIELINSLTSALKNGAVEGGYRGELVARLLLLKAWDDVYEKLDVPSTRIHYSRFITLSEFLKSLLADNAYKKIALRLQERVSFTGTEFGQAYIKFTHFISITYTPDRKDLLDALIRGVAFSCKRNQEGADIIIPMYIGALNEEPSTDRISYILIQVKNWAKNIKGGDYPLSATVSLSPASVGIEQLPHMPFLSLYMQLGSSKGFSEDPSGTVETKGAVKRKHKIDEVLQDYNTDCDDTRDRFLKRIRTKLSEDTSDVKKEPNKDVLDDASDAEIVTFQRYFQIPLAVFGLSSEVYGCLEQATTHTSVIGGDLKSSFKQLLTAWVDPTLGGNSEEVEIVKRMEPM